MLKDLKKYTILSISSSETYIDKWLLDSFKEVLFESEQDNVLNLYKLHGFRVVIIDLDNNSKFINIARFLKSLDKKIYIVAINSYSNSDILIEAINSSFFDKFIIKPFKKTSLMNLFSEIIDILEQERSLIVSQERLSLALNGTNAGLWDLDIIANNFFLSDKLLDILGYKKDEIVLSFQDFIRKICHSEDLGRVLKASKDAIKKREDNYSIEHRIFKKSKDIIWVLNRCKIVFNEKNEPIRMVGYITDISKEKKILNSYTLSKFSNDNSPEEILWIRKDATFEYVNNTACRYLGFTKEEFLTKKLSDIDLNSAYLPENFDTTWDYLKSKKNINFKTIQVRKDGTKMPIEVYASLFKFGNKELIFAFGRDITKKEEIEKQLIDSEAKFRDMFSEHSAVMFLFDPKRKVILEGNRSAYEYYGYKKSEFDNISIYKINTTEAKAIDENIEKVLSGLDKSFFTKHKLSNGEIRDVEIHSTPININNNLVLFSIIDDITQRIKMEESVKKQSNFLQMLIDTLPIPIFFKDKNFIFRLYNRAFEDFIGVSNIRGRRAKEFLGDDLLNVCQIMDDEVLDSKKEHVIKQDVKIFVNNSYKYITLYKSSLYVDSDNSGIIGAIFDITDLKEAEKKLYEKSELLESLNLNLENRVESELEQRREQEQMLIQQSKMAQMGEMIGAIAHQWRQPLNAIYLLVQSIEDSFEYEELTSESLGEFSKKISNQIEFMVKTIDDFRNFFKPSKLKQRFDILETIDEVLMILEYVLKNSNIEVSINKKSDVDYELFSYSNELKQVILNIIINAKDSILEKNESKREILIDINGDNDSILIDIKDTGVGISSAIKEKIFDPYTSTKGEKGTGIGLYMSKIIIEKNMNGKLLAQNYENGAVFSISLPKK